MRKPLALLLMLALLTCPAALAEEEFIDLGFIRWRACENDMVQVNEKADGQVLAYVYPDFRPEDAFHTHWQVVWHSEVIAMPEDLEDFAAAAMDSAIQDFAGPILTVSNPRLVDYSIQDDLPAIMLTYQADVDYAALADFAATLYFNQLIYPMEGDGTYSVTVISDSEFISTMRALEIAVACAAQRTGALDGLFDAK